MIHAILLDAYQDEVDPDQYAVTYSGSLEECREQTNHDGRFRAFLKSDFIERGSEPTQLEAPTGRMDAGRIVALEDVASPLWAGFVKFGLPVAAAVGIAGAITLSRRRKQRSRKRRTRR